ncbi:HAD family hydrolase, partial [Klebsiella pneumoniae]
VVVVVCDSHPVGLLAITDQLRPEAAAAISAATKLTGAKPVLLTGDNRATADRLGVQVGIDDVRAGLLPDDKVAAVRQL